MQVITWGRVFQALLVLSPAGWRREVFGRGPGRGCSVPASWSSAAETSRPTGRTCTWLRGSASAGWCNGPGCLRRAPAWSRAARPERIRPAPTHDDQHRHSWFPLFYWQKKSRTFQTPMKSFPGPFWSPWMFKYKEKNGIYLQYSRCSPLQKIQHKAKCGQQLFRIQKLGAIILLLVFHFKH